MWHGAEGCSNLHVLPLHSIGQGEGRAWGPFPALHPWGSIPPAPKPNHTNPGSQYKRLKLIGFFPSKPVGGSRERSAMGWGVGGGGEGLGPPHCFSFPPQCSVTTSHPGRVPSSPTGRHQQNCKGSRAQGWGQPVPLLGGTGEALPPPLWGPVSTRWPHHITAHNGVWGQRGGPAS